MTEPTPAQKLIGDFAPKLVALTDDVLFGDVWARSELSPRVSSAAGTPSSFAVTWPGRSRTG